MQSCDVTATLSWRRDYKIAYLDHILFPVVEWARKGWRYLAWAALFFVLEMPWDYRIVGVALLVFPGLIRSFRAKCLMRPSWPLQRPERP